MQALSDRKILDLWERGHARGPVERALLLLEAAIPAGGETERGETDIGTRDAAVLRLRQATFGAHLPGSVACPGCGSTLEFDLDTDDILAGSLNGKGRTIAIEDGLRFRLPNSLDLIASSHCPGSKLAAREILNRCCLDADHSGAWTPGQVVDIGRRMAAMMGAADVQLQLSCVACGCEFSERLDAPEFFWSEIERRAQFLLDEVHRLASAYGWDEGTVLSLTPARRAAYLARCDA